MKYFVLLILMSNIFANAYMNINILGTGLLLPYSIGIIAYMKKNIPIKSYELTGVSGGAWCSLLYAMEDDLSDHDKIWKYTIGYEDIQIRIHNNLNEFHSNIEYNLKKRYKNKKLTHRIRILATQYENSLCKISSVQKSKFRNVDDLIDFCSCSSYIPYISGSLLCKEYDNKYYMDGDIMRDSKIVSTKSSYNSLSIHRNMWGRKFPLNNYIYTDINTSRQLYKQGWEDTNNNKHMLLKYIPKNLLLNDAAT